LPSALSGRHPAKNFFKKIFAGCPDPGTRQIWNYGIPSFAECQGQSTRQSLKIFLFFFL
jgi:hypothetical protein